MIFIVYLVGGTISPTAGRAIDRYGQRRAVVAAATVTITGALITLAPALWAVVLGLTLASCGLVRFAILRAQPRGRCGAKSPGARGRTIRFVLLHRGQRGFHRSQLALDRWHWPGCITAAIAVQVAMMSIVWFGWKQGNETNVYLASHTD